ncbi:MAG: hypothetical protein HRU20_23210 [Pseudomonadales bacterium]|nr:hypothetical protein [Pseudomonadales bacterium]
MHTDSYGGVVIYQYNIEVGILTPFKRGYMAFKRNMYNESDYDSNNSHQFSDRKSAIHWLINMEELIVSV